MTISTERFARNLRASLSCFDLRDVRCVVVMAHPSAAQTEQVLAVLRERWGSAAIALGHERAVHSLPGAGGELLLIVPFPGFWGYEPFLSRWRGLAQRPRWVLGVNAYGYVLPPGRLLRPVPWLLRRTARSTLARLSLFAWRRARSLSSLCWRPASRAGRPPHQARRIAIFEPGLLGDVALLVPALAALRAARPAAHLTLIGSPAAGGWLVQSGLVDDLLPFTPPWTRRRLVDPRDWGFLGQFVGRLRARQFDLSLDFRGDSRTIILAFLGGIPARAAHVYRPDGLLSAEEVAFLLTHPVFWSEPEWSSRHRWELNLQLLRHLGFAAAAPRPWLTLPPSAVERAGRLLSEAGVTPPFVVVHPGASVPEKRWPADRFAQLINALTAELGWPVVLTGTAQEASLAEEIGAACSPPPAQIMGRTDLFELGAVLQQAALLICGDTGPMHLAALVDTPTVAIVPGNPAVVGPWSSRARAVLARWERCYCPFIEHCVCPYGTFPCLRDVPASEVLAAVRDLLTERESQP